MKKRIAVSLGLTATYTAALTVMNLLSEYTLDVKHILSHVLLSAILLLCAKLLLTEKVPAFFHPFILLELNVFDRFQYSLAQTMMSLASTLRKAQTGNLNLNMLGVVIGLIICFILLLLLGLMRF